MPACVYCYLTSTLAQCRSYRCRRGHRFAGLSYLQLGCPVIMTHEPGRVIQLQRCSTDSETYDDLAVGLSDDFLSVSAPNVRIAAA